MNCEVRQGRQVTAMLTDIDRVEVDRDMHSMRIVNNGASWTCPIGSKIILTYPKERLKNNESGGT